MIAERRRGWIVPAVLAALALAVLLGLGTWQLERLQWKNALAARIEQRLRLDPTPVPPPAAWAGIDFDAWEYRPVTATGRFDHAHEVRVYTLLPEPKGPFGGAGYMVLTPLILSDGAGQVIVNRGFVPQDKADPAQRRAGQTEGEVTVRGLLRRPEADNSFTPAPEPGKKLFFSRDAAVIADAYGLEGVAPFTIDADSAPNPEGLPQGGETRVAFPNRHLEYALTWYGLGLTLIGVFAAWALSRRTRG